MQTMNKNANETTPLYQYPLCDFDGKCVNDGTLQEQVLKETETERETNR